MGFLDRFTDYTPTLRCAAEEAVGVVTRKAFVKDAGFGDCPMEIDYEFTTSMGDLVTGRFEGTESCFYGLKVGDRISVRYLKEKPRISAPLDSIAIILPIREGAERAETAVGNNFGEQGGARQPTTALDSKSEGNEKPNPESEGRSQ
jgi:hypothetical protein